MLTQFASNEWTVVIINSILAAYAACAFAWYCEHRIVQIRLKILSKKLSFFTFILNRFSETAVRKDVIFMQKEERSRKAIVPRYSTPFQDL